MTAPGPGGTGGTGASVRAMVAESVEDALRAPSVHNTQPWRWRLRGGTVELHADWTRHLTATDPDRRDLLVSCGAALHHLTVALAARGLAVDVTRLPDPENPAHLATVRVTDGRPDTGLGALYPALLRRHTDRRRFAEASPTADELEALAARGRDSGVVVLVLTGAALERLAAVLVESARRQRDVPGYAAELRHWTHRHPGSHDGVVPESVPRHPPVSPAAAPLRDFGHGRLRPVPEPPGAGTTNDGSVALVVLTAGDTPLDSLRAGEAASAILLAATAAGMATTPLSQGLETAQSRRAVRFDVLGVPENPQVVLRVGRPAPGSEPLPPTPRRPLRSVLLSGRG
ncbi:Acg family FMN-binding oxidoreductase [Pseudonocardia sp.]|uniref:Acg family FMN-binding oxidoreductase n=1 Tax=Pseudonocardia sp. TaxID=60912 RepID=UPI003D144EC5